MAFEKATIKETVDKIRQVGTTNVRKVPNSGGTMDIQVCESGNWRTILSGVLAGAADDIIRQATNKVLLG